MIQIMQTSKSSGDLDLSRADCGDPDWSVQTGMRPGRISQAVCNPDWSVQTILHVLCSQLGNPDWNVQTVSDSSMYCEERWILMGWCRQFRSPDWNLERVCDSSLSCEKSWGILIGLSKLLGNPEWIVQRVSAS
jgi:hypothetical protein